MIRIPAKITYLTPFAFCALVQLSVFSNSLTANPGPGGAFRKSVGTIVLDAGHGGKDSGCLGTGSQEKQMTLAMVLKLRDKLQATLPDVQVILTREDDTFIPLNERARIANKAKADLFISIHCNSLPGASHICGTETYVLGTHRENDNLAVAKRENASILLEENFQENYGGFDPNSDAGHIFMSLFQHAYRENSVKLAAEVEKQFTSLAKRKSRGVREAGFLVLRETAMPSILIETGYVTHHEEGKFLASDKGQELLTDAILNGIANYYQYIEVLVNAPNPGELPALASSGSKTSIPAGPPSSAKANAPSKKPATSPSAPESKATPEEPEVIFWVQVSATRAKQEFRMSGLPEGCTTRVVQENDLFKSQAGGCKDAGAALQVLKVLENKGMKGCFLTGYRGGQRLSATEIKSLVARSGK